MHARARGLPRRVGFRLIHISDSCIKSEESCLRCVFPSHVLSLAYVLMCLPDALERRVDMRYAVTLVDHFFLILPMSSFIFHVLVPFHVLVFFPSIQLVPSVVIDCDIDQTRVTAMAYSDASVQVHMPVLSCLRQKLSADVTCTDTKYPIRYSLWGGGFFFFFFLAGGFGISPKLALFAIVSIHALCMCDKRSFSFIWRVSYSSHSFDGFIFFPSTFDILFVFYTVGEAEGFL